MNNTELTEWLARRRLGIGGSDISAIAGVNPYKTATDVFLDKLGLSEPQAETEAMRWGNALEPVIATRFANDYGIELERGVLTIDRERPHLLGTPDFLIQGKPAGLEVKTVGLRQARFWGEEGTDQAPKPYLAQCHWYQMLTSRDEWYIAALVAGQDFRVYKVIRDLEIEEALRDLAEKFWQDHILTQSPPDPTSLADEINYLKARFPKAESDLILDADSVGKVLLDQCADARSKFDTAEENKKSAEAQIKALIGDSKGLGSDKYTATWTNNKDSEVVDYKGLMSELNPATEIIQKYTTIKTGARVFRFKESKNA
jgi:putative phage-type endonuclease